MAARHHYELGRNASAQIYSPAQRLASHSFVRRSQASVRLPGLASRDGWKIDRYHAAALHPMACVAMSIADLASHIIVAMETPYTVGAVMP